MSIIYDALKKVEGTTADLKERKHEDKPKTKNKNHYLIYAFVVVAGLAIANFAFSYFSKSALTIPEAKTTPEAPAKTIAAVPEQKEIAVEKIEIKKLGNSDFSLNGIFFSEDDTYALVNNQVVKIGDSVNGATVKDITVNTVVLGLGDEELTLNTAHQ
jgi:hypothetical protein